ncbi:hypothetical protein Tco_0564747 [Tanacetum coccineum]
MSGTIDWGASTVVGVFSHMLFGDMKEDSASFAYQAELESLALKLEEENETLMKAKGLLEGEKEYVDTIKDAAHWEPVEHLRDLSVTLLSQKELTTPLTVWSNMALACRRCAIQINFFKCLQFELPEDVVNKTLRIILELQFFKSSPFDLCSNYSSKLFSNPSYQQSNHIVLDYSHHFQLAIYSGVVSPLATRKVHVHG